MPETQTPCPPLFVREPTRFRQGWMVWRRRLSPPPTDEARGRPLDWMDRQTSKSRRQSSVEADSNKKGKKTPCQRGRRTTNTHHPSPTTIVHHRTLAIDHMESLSSAFSSINGGSSQEKKEMLKRQISSEIAMANVRCTLVQPSRLCSRRASDAQKERGKKA